METLLQELEEIEDTPDGRRMINGRIIGGILN
jgi:hypothetical protein